jgi:Protein of unknown function (DUF995)
MKQVGAPIVALIISILPVSAQADPGAPANDAKPVSVAQLYQVYSNKTWVWPDGGGYFASDGRFSAWSGKGAAASYAEGRWWTTAATGDVCFEAIWRSAKAIGPNRSCFAHREIGGVIYQKKEPTGAWYQFKQSPGNPSDEIHKLQEGDLVTEDVRKLKSSIKKE